MPKASPSDQILEELGRVIRSLARLSGGHDDETSMTSTQRLALFELSEAGPLRLAELAERMGTSAPTASRAVDALTDQGFVERGADASDRRALRLELSEHGHEQIAARRALVAAAFRPAADTLPAADRKRLAELLAQLARALAAQ